MASRFHGQEQTDQGSTYASKIPVWRLFVLLLSVRHCPAHIIVQLLLAAASSSSFLETIYEGSHACGDMGFYDYLTGMIPSRIFLHAAWLFLVFVLLFPVSRAIRVTRRMIMPDAEKENKSKHTNKNIERTIQGILLTIMIIAITVHLFIHTLNQVEVRRYPPYDRKPGEVESYAAFPFLQLLANVILLGVSKSRLSGLSAGNVMDLRLMVCSIPQFFRAHHVTRKGRSAKRICNVRPESKIPLQHPHDNPPPSIDLHDNRHHRL
jgi:hypothetical protein